MQPVDRIWIVNFRCKSVDKLKVDVNKTSTIFVFDQQAAKKDLVFPKQSLSPYHLFVKQLNVIDYITSERE